MSKSELHTTQNIGYNNHDTIGPEFKTYERSAGTGLNKPLIPFRSTPQKNNLPSYRIKNKTVVPSHRYDFMSCNVWQALLSLLWPISQHSPLFRLCFCLCLFLDKNLRALKHSHYLPKHCEPWCFREGRREGKWARRRRYIKWGNILNWVWAKWLHSLSTQYVWLLLNSELRIKLQSSPWAVFIILCNKHSFRVPDVSSVGTADTIQFQDGLLRLQKPFSSVINCFH